MNFAEKAVRTKVQNVVVLITGAEPHSELFA